MIDFWSLSPDEIEHGMKIAHAPHLALPNDPLKEFIYNGRLQQMGTIWEESNQDMTVMKLKYLDYIMNFKYDTIWFSWNGLA